MATDELTPGQRDLRAYQRRKRTILSVIGAVQVAIASLLFLGFYLFTQRLEDRINHQDEVLTRICVDLHYGSEFCTIP